MLNPAWTSLRVLTFPRFPVVRGSNPKSPSIFSRLHGPGLVAKGEIRESIALARCKSFDLNQGAVCKYDLWNNRNWRHSAMRRSRSTAVAQAFAAVLLVFSCCLGFTHRAQDRVPQERAPGAHAQAPGDRQSSSALDFAIQTEFLRWGCSIARVGGSKGRSILPVASQARG